MDTSRLAALTFVIASALPIAAGQDRPPMAPVRPVTDIYFGTPIVDPYRWMEDTKSPELTAWMAAQNRYTRSVLDRLPLRRELLERIGSLSGASDDLSLVMVKGGKYFTVRIGAGRNQPAVYVRDGLAGVERVLIDPETLSSDGRRYSITYFAPSQDGRYVAYGTAPGGSGDAVLRVIETATGRDMGERIDRTDLGNPSWLPDGRSFFYHRRKPLPPGAPPAARFQDARVFLHRLGDDPDNDIPVFGSNVSPLVPLDAALMASVTTVPDSSVMFAYVTADVRFKRIYAAPLASVRESPIPWSLVVDVPDQVTAIDVHGDDLYLLTSRDAPRRKIVRTSLARPDLAAAQTIVPESEAVITSMHVARDALYVQTLDGGLRRLSRVGFAGGPLRRVSLPYEASASRAATNPREPGVVFRLASWTKAPAWFRYDPSSDRVTDTRLLPAPPIDFSGIESMRVHVRSYDGTMVPLSIVFSRSVKRDGSNPTLLGGFGAYGSVTDPAFRPRRLAWLERGGVYAFAHVRGGGDYGEEWHRAGQKLNKMNSVRDFIACAEYLIKEGFTSPAHLAGEGFSAGATLIGGAITERPDLFAAAIGDRGGFNALRLEAEPNGPPNIPEFGSVKTPDGFKGLLAMDAYHHIKDGTPYPAVLILTADNDGGWRRGTPPRRRRASRLPARVESPCCCASSPMRATASRRRTSASRNSLTRGRFCSGSSGRARRAVAERARAGLVRAHRIASSGRPLATSAAPSTVSTCGTELRAEPLSARIKASRAAASAPAWSPSPYRL